MARSGPLDRTFSDGELDSFERFMTTVTYTERNPLNTEAFYMWCMLRRDRPVQFIESGTFKGYSANFICEALSHNDNSPQFTTIGFDLENCLVEARARLEPYPFARVVEGDSFDVIETIEDKSLSTAFFIDGPKGKNLKPFLKKVFALFPNICFVAIHDAEPDGKSGNRRIALSYAHTYDVFFCGSEFQTHYARLDEPLFKVMAEDLWRPYRLKGQPISSYGTETAFIVPNAQKASALGQIRSLPGRLATALRG